MPTCCSIILKRLQKRGFDTKLIKIKTNAKKGGEYFGDAIKLLEEDCPKKSCVWCERV